MIKRVRLGQPTVYSQVPACSIILCPNCLDPQYFAKTAITVQSGCICGVWGILFPDKVKGIKHRCHNCDYNIFETKYTRTSSIAFNMDTSPAKYVATYIHCRDFASYLAGIMLLEYSLDPCNEIWVEWVKMGTGVMV